MQLIDINRIHVPERQRRSIAPGPLRELRESILTRGLLQPPGGYFDADSGNWVLVWGERRLRAIQSLQAEGHSFSCNGVSVSVGTLPFLLLNEISDTSVAEAELEENIIRVDLDWQDRTRALAAIHELRKKANPQQTVRDTAIELVEKGGAGPLQSQIGFEKKIAEAVRIAPHLDNPNISKARNAAEANALVLKGEEEKYRALLARRSLAKVSTVNDLELREGDLNDILPSLEGGTFDLILADPPYGVDAGAGGFRSRSVHHHNYEDSVEIARSVALTILMEGFRLTKSRANLFMFGHPRLWNWLYDTAANMGWTPFPVPIVWQKSESEGLAPWGSAGFRRTYDMIFYATKNKGLLASPTDILSVKRVGREERIHAAEKPVELLSKLIECSTLPGDFVLDPCCGSGSTLLACRETRRRGLGIEKDPGYFNTAMANVHGRTKGASL